MNHVLMRISQGLLVAAAATAIFEMNWLIPVVLFGAGFVGCIVSGFVQASVEDIRYEAAVLEHRLAEDPVHVKVASSDAVVSLIALVTFGLCAFASIRTNSPLPAAVGFVIAATFGILWYGRANDRRNEVWSEFASHNGLQFTRGNAWSRFENPKIVGQHAQRSVQLELVWQDTGSSGTGKNSSRRLKEVLVGEISTSATDDVSFCVDDGKPKPNDIEFAQQLFSSSSIAAHLTAAQPKRVSLFEGSLSIHMPRVPQTSVELRFYLQLLSDIAVEIERELPCG